MKKILFSILLLVSVFINFNNFQAVYAQYSDPSQYYGVDSSSDYSYDSSSYSDSSLDSIGSYVGSSYEATQGSWGYDETYCSDCYVTPSYGSYSIAQPPQVYTPPAPQQQVWSVPSAPQVQAQVIYQQQAPVYQPQVYSAPAVQVYTPQVYTPQVTYYTCWNGQQVTNQANCPAQTKTCPNGAVMLISQTCPAQTKTCANGTVTGINEVCYKSCPSGEWIPETQTCPVQIQYQTCWDGTKIPTTQTCPNKPSIYCAINGQTYNSQIEYNNGCVQTKKTCQNGSVVNVNETCYKSCPNGSSIPETSVCPAQTQTCWDGSVIPTSQTCPAQTKTCANGNKVLLSQTCTKTCPNGANIPEYDTCPAQTKTCLSGKVVGINETCYKTCSNGLTVTESQSCPVVSNHKVVTTQATNATINSCRFNGIAMVANGVSTIGYFEYGTSNSLGLSTNQANIGKDTSISYSNVVDNLKSGTTYYYRAVITNANGTYKGDITTCRTGSATSTKKPATPISTKITTVKKAAPAKKAVVVCQDMSGNSSELAEGDKFVTLDITKNGALAPGQIVEYKVSYKNKSQLDLNNAYIKLSVPEGFTYVGNDGQRDGSDIRYDIGTIDAGEQGFKIFKFQIDKNAAIGSSVVSSAYVYYEMLDKDGSVVSDENSTYTVGAISNETGNTTSSSSSSANETWFSLLLKWLLIIILFIILIILARYIWRGVMHKRYARQVLGS